MKARNVQSISILDSEQGPSLRLASKRGVRYDFFTVDRLMSAFEKS